MAVQRLPWLVARVTETWQETATARSIAFDVPGWPGHAAGQHLDLRVTAEDGYRAQRGYSIAAPADGTRIVLTVQRITDGEVSPYLVDDLAEDEAAGDRVIGEHPAGLRERPRLDDRVDEQVAVAHVGEIENLAGEVGDPGAMGEDVTDRDLLLAVAAVLGDVLADRSVDLEQAALASGFLAPGSRLRERWRRLFSRVPALEREEVNIVRGLLKALMPPKPGRHEPRE
jgi:hypothetical protein